MTWHKKTLYNFLIFAFEARFVSVRRLVQYYIYKCGFTMTTHDIGQPLSFATGLVFPKQNWLICNHVAAVYLSCPPGIQRYQTFIILIPEQWCAHFKKRCVLRDRKIRLKGVYPDIDIVTKYIQSNYAWSNDALSHFHTFPSVE